MLRRSWASLASSVRCSASKFARNKLPRPTACMTTQANSKAPPLLRRSAHGSSLPKSKRITRKSKAERTLGAFVEHFHTMIPKRHFDARVTAATIESHRHLHVAVPRVFSETPLSSDSVVAQFFELFTPNDRSAEQCDETSMTNANSVADNCDQCMAGALNFSDGEDEYSLHFRVSVDEQDSSSEEVKEEEEEAPIANNDAPTNCLVGSRDPYFKFVVHSVNDALDEVFPIMEQNLADLKDRIDSPDAETNVQNCNDDSEAKGNKTVQDDNADCSDGSDDIIPLSNHPPVVYIEISQQCRYGVSERMLEREPYFYESYEEKQLRDKLDTMLPSDPLDIEDAEMCLYDAYDHPMKTISRRGKKSLRRSNKPKWETNERDIVEGLREKRKDDGYVSVGVRAVAICVAPTDTQRQDDAQSKSDERPMRVMLLHGNDVSEVKRQANDVFYHMCFAYQQQEPK